MKTMKTMTKQTTKRKWKLHKTIETMDVFAFIREVLEKTKTITVILLHSFLAVWYSASVTILSQEQFKNEKFSPSC